MTVSVIIPTYNRANLVQHTIDSVLKQTYTDYEIIVIDDGSTDDTKQKLMKYDSLIQYVYQENKGLNAARNAGLNLATGDYIALLDSDDLWLDFKLQLQIDLLNEYPEVGFIFSDFFIFSTGGRNTPNGLRTWHENPYDWNDVYATVIEKPAIVSNTLSKESKIPFNVYFGDIYDLSLQDPIVLPSTSLVRRSCIDNNFRFFEHNSFCGTDWDFFARLSHKSGAAYIDMETTLNRSHEDAVRLTRIDPGERINMRLEMIHRIWESDTEYSASNRDNINSVKHDLLINLLKNSLSTYDIYSARQAVGKLNMLNSDKVNFKGLLLTLLVYIPGIQKIYTAVRKLKHIFS